MDMEMARTRASWRINVMKVNWVEKVPKADEKEVRSLGLIGGDVRTS